MWSLNSRISIRYPIYDELLGIIIFCGLQIEKIETGLKVYTDKGDVLETDVVLMAVGKSYLIMGYQN